MDSVCLECHQKSPIGSLNFTSKDDDFTRDENLEEIFPDESDESEEQEEELPAPLTF